MAIHFRGLELRNVRRFVPLRCSIAAGLVAGLVWAGTFWNSNRVGNDRADTRAESTQLPAHDVATVTDGLKLETPQGEPQIPDGEPDSAVRFVPSAGGSPPEVAERTGGTALAQFGNGGPGGMLPGSGANQGRPGAGNGTRFPGGNGQFNGGGQGSGGVHIAPIIRLAPNATAALADRHDNSVSQRPASGRFFSD